MNKQQIEEYRNKMMKMYSKKTNSAVSAMSDNIQENKNVKENKNVGFLTAVVTTIKSLYPVPNAKVTIFTGDLNDKNIIDSAFTDMSGRTKEFTLSAPNKDLSLDKDETKKPYSEYNMMVEADGYIDNIHLNIPIFSGVNSIQRSNLLSTATSGINKKPQIYDESRKYDL